VKIAKEVIKVPRGDGTGPMGLGPMTGRVAGYCAGYGVPGYRNPYAGGRGFGLGRGRGFGRGRGMRGRWFYGNPYLGGTPYPTAPVSYPIVADPVTGSYALWQVIPQQEMEMLQSETKMLEEQLAIIKKRIVELEKEAVKGK